MHTFALTEPKTVMLFSSLNHLGVINHRQKPQIYDVVNTRTRIKTFPIFGYCPV